MWAMLHPGKQCLKKVIKFSIETIKIENSSPQRQNQASLLPHVQCLRRLEKC